MVGFDDFLQSPPGESMYNFSESFGFDCFESINDDCAAVEPSSAIRGDVRILTGMMSLLMNVEMSDSAPTFSTWTDGEVSNVDDDIIERDACDVGCNVIDCNDTEAPALKIPRVNRIEDNELLFNIASSSSSSVEQDIVSITKLHPLLKAKKPPILPRFHLLVIDDSIVQRKVTRSKLSGIIDSEDWLVDTAESAERALQILSVDSPTESPLVAAATAVSSIPDVMIVDQNMFASGGRMLGHEFVARVRSHGALQQTIIIGCTAYPEEASVLMMEAGCDAVWVKPSPSKEEMRLQIQQLRSRRNLQQHT
jgi:CheY-like chemotaxis protein